MSTYQVFCENITNSLFEIIDTHQSLLTWQKSWDTQGCVRLPQGSQGLYHGGNLLSLLITQMSKGFQTNKWLTFNQIKQLKGLVQKGAKSTEVYFWKLLPKTNETNGVTTQNDTDIDTKLIPLFKSYRVFNVEQTTLNNQTEADSLLIEQHVEDLIKKLNVTISHFGNEAYYDKLNDIIVIPYPERFKTINNYYATLLHELIHWTGGKQDRIARKCMEDYSINEKARAEEELIAEIGSVFLTTHFNIQGELNYHASYIKSWKQNLNTKQVMNAATLAAKAFEWLIKTGL